MRIRQAKRMLLVLAILLLSVAVSSVSAQDNLLANPGFEPPFDPVEGVVPGQIAQGWTPWFLTTEDALQPEYYPASDTISGMGSPRIHGGDEAQQYFTFFSSHIAGVYQHVTGVAAGDVLEFSIYAWLWSTSAEDTSASAADADMTIEVGIDPSGGEDAADPAVVWSEPVSTYDEFIQLSVSATAEGEAVTVFVRSTVQQVLMNNVVYLDDASLTVTGQAAIVEETEEATEAATDEVAVTEEPTDEATEPVVEATPEVTETPVVAEVTPEVTAPVVVEITEVATVEETDEATPEVTAEATATSTEVPTEAATEEPTAEVTSEVTEEATVLPTDVPVVVELTATFTSSPVPPTVAPTATEVVPTAEPPTVAPPTATTEPPTPVPPTPTPSPTLNLTVFPFAIPYTVQSGDFVAAIAERFTTTTEAIIIANGLNADAFISAGQQLIIPVASLPQPTLPPTATPEVFVVIVEPTATVQAPVVIVETPIPTEVQAQIIPAPTATQPATIRYVVQYGDTLSSIASRFRVSARELARLNRIVNPNLVYSGQVLLIPTAGSPTPTSIAPTQTHIAPTPVPPTLVPTQSPVYRVYRVMPGDTLYLISIRLNVRISDLIRLNRIADANRIYVGQLLYIP